MPGPRSDMYGSRTAIILDQIGSRSDRFLGTAPINYNSEGRQQRKTSISRQRQHGHLDEPLPRGLGVEKGKVDSQLIDSRLARDIRQSGKHGVQPCEGTRGETGRRVIGYHTGRRAGEAVTCQPLARVARQVTRQTHSSAGSALGVTTRESPAVLLPAASGLAAAPAAAPFSKPSSSRWTCSIISRSRSSSAYRA